MTEKKDRNEADRKHNGAGTPPKVGFTAGLDAPIPTVPARLVGYNSSLSRTNTSPPKGPSVQQQGFQ